MTATVDRPFDAVLFDFHGTLFQVEEPRTWLRLGAEAVGVEIPDPEALLARFNTVGRPGGPLPKVVPAHLADAYERRDLSSADHRRAYVGLLAEVDPDLADTLYDRLFIDEAWVPYADAPRVARELHRRGVKTAVVSNIGWDLRPLFAAHGMAQDLDAYVFSFEVGMIKPDPEIFRLACAKLGVAEDRTLMVGDTVADGGAVHAGLRSLLLPTSPPGAVHGLDLVLSLVGP